MRSYKKIKVDFGVVVPREELAYEFTRGSQMNPSIRYCDATMTFTHDPRFPRGLMTVPQISYLSSDEKKVMRIIQKYGGRIIQTEDSMQRGGEETDLTTRGKTHEFERSHEIIDGEKLEDYILRMRK